MPNGYHDAHYDQNARVYGVHDGQRGPDLSAAPYRGPRNDDVYGHGNMGQNGYRALDVNQGRYNDPHYSRDRYDNQYGGAPRGVDPHYGQVPYGGYAASSGLMPNDSEFFVNVTLDETGRAEHATLYAKAQGRKALGRAGSMVGGLLGGNVVADTLLSKELAEEVRAVVMQELQKQGWNSYVTNLMLPPDQSSDEWQVCLRPPMGGVFFALRVQALGRTVSGSQGSGGFCGVLDHFRECCCPPTAPGFNHSTSYKISPKIKEALRQQPIPINAFIDISDANEEVRALMQQGLKEEAAVNAIRASRGVSGIGR